jgi:thiol:disulfide interchange protein DsbA
MGVKMKALMKSALLFTAVFTLFAGSTAAFAQPALYVDGVHYETIAKPVRTADPNKIEVTEVFWYGCPHCYAFEPLIESWSAGLPSDVAFVRTPGMWNAMMETHAQIYYTAVAMGVFDKIHSVTFNEFHQKRNYLQTQDAVRAMFVAQGIDPAEFDKTWTSFSVSSEVKRAATKMRDYGITGVPSLIVNGKYRVIVGDSNGIRTQADMLKVADFLIGKERNG